MSSSFSIGTATVQPDVIDGYSADRATRHRFQDIPGSDAQDVFVYPAGLRSGRLSAVFSDYDDAALLASWAAGTSTIRFDDTDRPYLAMTFLANGPISMTLDPDTREVWVITLPFQEVSL